jgi:stage II sporulation protein AA (anti-sigma F factor antagonist)
VYKFSDIQRLSFRRDFTVNVQCSERNRNLIVKISGEIDHHTADAARGKIEREYARTGAKNIVFDFANVTFMDSSGVGMLIGRYRHLERLGGKVFAINISSPLERIFEVSGLKKIIGCYTNLSEAEKA